MRYPRLHGSRNDVRYFESKQARCRGIVDDFRPDLGKYEDIYRQVHQNPELSMVEVETASLASHHLQDLGFSKVIDGIGGHSLVGILRNDDGPTVLLRADMDALPVKELTGVPYSSSKWAADRFGMQHPVMHACGHDVHVACLMGVAELLFSAKATWSGTLICLFQSGEEDGAGARAMVDAGLFNRIPKPDVLLAQHVMKSKAGTLQIRSGPALSACDCFDVRLFGKGGHGSYPHHCIDPVLAACSMVVRFQGIVSREVDPDEFAVVTCVYLQTSRAVNIIPDTVDMKVDVRTYKPEIRKKVVQAVKRVIIGESITSGLPREPEIVQTDDIPPVINDEETVEKLTNMFEQHFAGCVSEMVKDPGSDDFAIFTADQGIPSAYWYIGGTDPKAWDEAKRKGTIDDLPESHSAYFAPAIEPTIKTGIDAMALAALLFLKIRDT